MHRRLVTTAALVLACATALSPARADEFTDVLQSALKAYDEGDIKVAGEELADGEMKRQDAELSSEAVK